MLPIDKCRLVVSPSYSISKPNIKSADVTAIRISPLWPCYNFLVGGVRHSVKEFTILQGVL